MSELAFDTLNAAIGVHIVRVENKEGVEGEARELHVTVRGQGWSASFVAESPDDVPRKYWLKLLNGWDEMVRLYRGTGEAVIAVEGKYMVFSTTPRDADGYGQELRLPFAVVAPKLLEAINTLVETD